MAWDTERTRRLLLDAGAGEFGAHGLAGARIDRISREAGVNRERIYSNFGNKVGLFEAVISDRLEAALDDVVFIGQGPTAVGHFAGSYFDALAVDPTLARLVAWEGLERSSVVDVEDRSARANRVIDQLCNALPGVHRVDVEDLFITIVTLSYGWLVIPNLARVVTGKPTDPDRPRRAIKSQAEALAETLARSRSSARSSGGDDLVNRGRG